MPRERIRIDTILEGVSETHYFGTRGQYNSAIAIDPDFPISETDVKTSGQIVPSRYEKFSGTEFTGFPMWIITQNKTTNSFIYASDGKLHSFDSSIAMRASDEASTAFPITITGGAGNGAVYYNNFIYFAEGTDITQYGGLDQGASIAKTENVWTGAKFGLTALTDTTYPTINGVEMPNHVMHYHSNNSVYIADVVDGQGVIHRMKTSKTTIEGDTNDGSEFNALDLPFGYFPTAMTSLGTDLVIAAIQTLDSSINQGNAALFFWDTFNSSFYRQLPLPDPLATAIINHNGILYIWTGNAQDGVRISRYVGGETIQEVVFLEEGLPPFASAVTSFGNRLVWGTTTTYPDTTASVFAFGSKKSRLPTGLHNIVRSTSAGANQLVSSVKVVQQADNKKPQLIVGWGDDDNKGLDKRSTTATFNSIWRSKVYNIGQEFNIEKVRISLGATLAANMTITPKIYVDNDTSTGTALTTINSTNFSGNTIIYHAPTDIGIRGNINFFIELAFTGTALCPVVLPIDIDIKTQDEI